MQIVFVNYNKFIESSGIHIFFIANELERLGIKCTACIPAHQDNVNVFGQPKFRIALFEDLENLTNRERIRLRLKNPIIHAWTPRENVRRYCAVLSRSLHARYYVHMEDNEENILEHAFQLPFPAIEKLPEDELQEQATNGLIHPLYYQPFLDNAAGVTCIIDTLEKFVPERVPRITFWPACEPELYDFPLTPDGDLRRRLGLDPDTTVLAYTGNLHKSNAEEIFTLYEAVGILNNGGDKVTLIRTGSDFIGYTSDVSVIKSRYVLDRGSCSAGEIREIISAADILVQPGSPDDFNNFRFPSKLPMYLASARPVILPAANIGRYLDDGRNCLQLKDGTASELAEKIKMLIDNPGLRHDLGRAGRQFAKTHFSWERTARALIDFYSRTGSFFSGLLRK